MIRSLGRPLRIRPSRLVLEAHRVVESQHVSATRKLVDSLEEQRELEEMIDGVKPPLPEGAPFAGLHYLLFTPFRHPPLPWGSRFGTAHERGIWYGSRELATAFAEVAYYRFVFLAGSSAKLTPLTTELTAFVAHVRGKRAVDLGRPPFAKHGKHLASKTSYRVSQAVGREMREAGVDAFLYPSARTEGGGTNVGLFHPTFARRKPTRFTTWLSVVDDHKVEIAEKALVRRTRQVFTFPRRTFEVRGALPLPAS